MPRDWKSLPKSVQDWATKYGTQEQVMNPEEGLQSPLIAPDDLLGSLAMQAIRSKALQKIGSSPKGSYFPGASEPIPEEYFQGYTGHIDSPKQNLPGHLEPRDPEFSPTELAREWKVYKEDNIPQIVEQSLPKAKTEGVYTYPTSGAEKLVDLSGNEIAPQLRTGPNQRLSEYNAMGTENYPTMFQAGTKSEVSPNDVEAVVRGLHKGNYTELVPEYTIPNRNWAWSKGQSKRTQEMLDSGTSSNPNLAEDLAEITRYYSQNKRK